MIVLALLAFALFAAWIPVFPLGAFNDEAIHVLAARSLCQGAYQNLALPGHPPLINPPPGYPLFLAPWLALAGSHWALLKWTSVLLMLAAGFLANRLFRGRLTPAQRLWLVALLWLNPLTVQLSGLVMAEAAFLVAVLLSLVALQRLLERSRWSDGVLLSFALSWAALLRPQGIVLTAAVGGGLCLARRWRSLSLLAAPVLALAGTFARNAHLTSHTSGYAAPWQRYSPAPLREVARTALETLVGGPFELRSLTFWLAAAGGALLMALALQAVLRRKDARKAQPLVLAEILFAIFYAGILLAWPAPQTRYFFPLLPFVWAWLLQAAVAPAALRLSCGLLLFAYGLRDRPARAAERPAIATEAYQWIREHCPPEARFFACRNANLFLYTGRQAIQFLPAADEEELRWRLERAGITHILYEPLPFGFIPSDDPRDPGRVWQISRHWVAASGHFPLLYQNPSGDTAVYQVPAEPSFLEAYAHYEAAMKAIENKDNALAARELAQSLRAYPRFARALSAEGARLWLTGGSLAEAEARLSASLQIAPDQPRTRWLLGLIQERRRGRRQPT